MKGRLSGSDINLLRVFSTVVDAGGFSAAQVVLNVSQSTISSQIAALETRLGTKLCHRGRSGFQLTASGRAVHAASMQLFSAVDHFTNEIRAFEKGLTGELHIGMLDALVNNPDCRLIQAISKFRERPSDVHIHLHVMAPLELERAVLDGEIHVGVGVFPARAAGLTYKKLFVEQHQLYCAATHPLFGEREGAIRIEDVQAAEYVKRGYFSETHEKLRPRMRATATANSMEGAAALILSGRYIGHLPIFYASPLVASRQMRVLIPDVFGYTSIFEAIVKSAVPQTKATSLFLADLIEGHAAAHDAAGDD